MATITDGPAPGSAEPPEAGMVEWLRFLQFGDSMLPVGAFAFSHGLESAIQQRVVVDAETLDDFVRTALDQAATSDAVALLLAQPAAAAARLDEVAVVDRALFNRKLNEEARSMSVRTGKKLIELAVRVTGAPLLGAWLRRVTGGEAPGTYPVCLATVFASLRLPAQTCFAVHQYGVAAAMLGAALRLMKVDHNDTQRILFGLHDHIAASFERSACMSLEDMAGFAPVVDVLAAIHVRSHVRLFMS